MRPNLLICVGLFVLLAGCAAPTETESAALEEAIERFYDHQFDEEDDLIFEEASAGFRRGASVDLIRRMNTFVRRIEGCGPRTRAPGFEWNRSLGGFFITRSYQSDCAPGPLFETFTFRIENETARLYSYNISGMAMFPLLNEPPPLETADGL